MSDWGDLVIGELQGAREDMGQYLDMAERHDRLKEIRNRIEKSGLLNAEELSLLDWGLGL